MKKYLGILGLLTVTIIWGGGFVASDMALETLTPFQIMAIRFFIAAVFMTVLAGKQIRTIQKRRCEVWFLAWNSSVCGVRTSDHRIAVYNTI